MSFVDTNVLVYATARSAPFRDRSRAALARLAASEPLAVSRQILREYIAVMTREQTWGKALTLAEATADAAAFGRRFRVLEDGPSVWDQLMELSRRYSFGGRQVHDANVVATMLAHGERRLLTFNEADFRRFTPLIEVVAPQYQRARRPASRRARATTRSRSTCRRVLVRDRGGSHE